MIKIERAEWDGKRLTQLALKAKDEAPALVFAGWISETYTRNPTAHVTLKIMANR